MFISLAVFLCYAESALHSNWKYCAVAAVFIICCCCCCFHVSARDTPSKWNECIRLCVGSLFHIWLLNAIWFVCVQSQCVFDVAPSACVRECMHVWMCVSRSRSLACIIWIWMQFHCWNFHCFIYIQMHTLMAQWLDDTIFIYTKKNTISFSNNSSAENILVLVPWNLKTTTNFDSNCGTIQHNERYTCTCLCAFAWEREKDRLKRKVN